MNAQPGFKPVIKVIAFWFGFLILHYLYEWIPFSPFALISGVSEAVFQHAKITFYTYLLVSLVEYLIYVKKVTNRKDYIFSRLLISLLVPWLMMLFWYIGPAMYGKPMPSIPLEIIYANLALLATAFSSVTLESAFSQIRFTRGQMVVIGLGLIIAITHFSVFTFQTPWADVFAPPVY